MAENNGKPIELDQLPGDLKQYVLELRKEKKASDVALKAANLELEQLRAAEKAADAKPVSVRKADMSDAEYRKYKKSFNEGMAAQHRAEKEARQAERIATALSTPNPEPGSEPVGSGKEPIKIESVRNLPDADYKRVRDAMRRQLSGSD